MADAGGAEESVDAEERKDCGRRWSDAVQPIRGGQAYDELASPPDQVGPALETPGHDPPPTRELRYNNWAQGRLVPLMGLQGRRAPERGAPDEASSRMHRVSPEQRIEEGGWEGAARAQGGGGSAPVVPPLPCDAPEHTHVVEPHALEYDDVEMFELDDEESVAGRECERVRILTDAPASELDEKCAAAGEEEVAGGIARGAESGPTRPTGEQEKPRSGND